MLKWVRLPNVNAGVCGDGGGRGLPLKKSGGMGGGVGGMKARKGAVGRSVAEMRTVSIGCLASSSQGECY